MAKPASKNPCVPEITGKSRCAPLGCNSSERILARDSEIRIRGGQRLRGIEARVPGDLSSAAFFLCAAALFPGSDLTLPNLLMNPTRARLLDVLMQMGVRISVTQLDEIHGELVGTLQVGGGNSDGSTIAGADSAALIDEIPVLAAIAPFTEKGIEIRDAKELRVKESDRIASVATNLRNMGAEVEEREDGLRIPGRQPLHGAELDSFGDHRIAMAFAIAALRADGETLIQGADSAAISYPAFFQTLDALANDRPAVACVSSQGNPRAITEVTCRRSFSRRKYLKPIGDSLTAACLGTLCAVALISVSSGLREGSQAVSDRTRLAKQGRPMHHKEKSSGNAGPTPAAKNPITLPGIHPRIPNVIYYIRPRDQKHAVTLQTGDRAEFRLNKGIILLRTEEAGSKEHPFVVISVSPASDTSAADVRSMRVNHLQ